jgi:hypothetical protein
LEAELERSDVLEPGAKRKQPELAVERRSDRQRKRLGRERQLVAIRVGGSELERQGAAHCDALSSDRREGRRLATAALQRLPAAVRDRPAGDTRRLQVRGVQPQALSMPPPPQ